jgi:cytoskeletal protein CcmA (bactofilin family)
MALALRARGWLAIDVLLRAAFIIGLVIGLVGLLVSFAAAQPKESAGAGERVVLEGTYSDVQFLAGRSVEIKAQVSDDVFAAGRNVTLDSAAVESAIVAGYDVEQRGGTAADFIVAGANVSIAGAVEDDLVAAARSLRVAAAGTIGGDARLAAETVDIEGRIGGSLRAAARRVTIAGTIAGKADIIAERIVVAPGATIVGDLIYRGDAEPEIADGATIGGEVRRIAIETPDLKAVGFAVLGIGLAIALFWTIAVLLLVAIVQLAFPGLMTGAADRLRASPWTNLGGGVAAVLLAGALAGGLLFSIVGIPLGAALMMATSVLSLFGLVAVSYRIGLMMRRSASEIGRGGRVGWALAGAVVLGLVALIPFVGGVVVGLLIAAGFGAAGAEIWKRLRAGPDRPLFRPDNQATEAEAA